MKNVKNIIAIVAVIVLIILGLRIFDYFLIDDTTSYTRIMMHEFYNQDNIDILLVGASHSYRGINPSIVEAETGKTVFNASSSGQQPDASLALVKEAINIYDVKWVFFELSFSIANSTGKYADRTDLTSTYAISDYMRPSFNKYQFLYNASSEEYYMNGYFPARRKHDDFMDWQYLSELYEKKKSEEYKTYAYDYVTYDDEWYAGNGYVASATTIGNSMFFSTDGFSKYKTKSISDDWRKSVLKLIEICQKSDVKLTIYTTPISNFELLAYGNYDEYISYVKEFLSETGVEYVDFNLLNEEYFPFLSTDYKDCHHLNLYGAEKFSRILSEYISGKLPAEAFCKTVKERLNGEKPAYYGITYHKGKKNKEFRLVANHPEVFEYAILITSKDGEEKILQEFNSNNTFTVPKEETGVLTIKYRLITNPDNVVTVERDY